MVNNKEHLIGVIDDYYSIIILQFQIEKEMEMTSYIISMYKNYQFEQSFKIKNQSPKQKSFAQDFKVFESLENVKYKQIVYKRDYIILENTKINLNSSLTLQDCQLEGITQNSKVCLLSDIKAKENQNKVTDSNINSFINKNNSEKDENNEEEAKRKLQAAYQLIHGTYMRSLVRNQQTNTQYTSIMQNLSNNNFLMIGYFYLTQTIIGQQYLPLITIGKFNSYYNLLNLYFVSSTIVELRFINDQSNVIETVQLTFPQSVLNTWVGIGFAYVTASYNACIVATNYQTNQLIKSGFLNSVTLTSTITNYFNLCIACQIPGGVFGQFQGSYSSVKIVYGISFGLLTGYYFLNENTVQKQFITSITFSMSSFVPGTEYILPEITTCQPTYAFFEGVCVQSAYCPDNEFEPDPYQAYEGGKYYDSVTQRCLSCIDNCVACTTATDCQQCSLGYLFVSGVCTRCDSVNPCPNSCTSTSQFDPLNQYCVSTFNQQTHQLNPILLSSRIFTHIDGFSVSPVLPQYNQLVVCYLNSANNFFTLYSFLGGSQFTTSTVVTKQFPNLPIGYMKRVQFIALLYGNTLPNQLYVKINNQYGSLNAPYTKIDQNEVACSDSGTLTQSIYQVEYFAYDNSTTLNLQITSFVNGWGIRNLNVVVEKCHPSCSMCFDGGQASDCTTCNTSQFIKNNFSCICGSGYYAQYSPTCYSPPCITCESCSIIANCIICEDITGNCVQCAGNYLLQDGQCVAPSSCTGNNQVFSNFCGVRTEVGFQQFQNSQIVQYGDYWQFYQNSVSAFSCFGNSYLPQIGSKNQHTLHIQLPNFYVYHYYINISLDVAAIDSLIDSNGDGVKIYDGSQLIFSGQFQSKDIQAGAQNYCANALYYDNHYTETFSESKSSPQFDFIFEADTSQPLSMSSLTFGNLNINYVRCHPLCLSCINSAASDCNSCIQNANSLSGSCQCNDGFYFKLVSNPSVAGSLPGQCLPCDPSCQTCSGPSAQSCLTCNDGYHSNTGICIYYCPDGQYWDYYAQQCQSCYTNCRTCFSSSQYGCRDCKINFVYIPQTHTCEQYENMDCSLYLSSYCGGSLQSHTVCISEGWTPFTSNTCTYCGNYVNFQCGGDVSQSVAAVCQNAGYINYSQTQCASCQIPNGSACGYISIQSTCQSMGWTQLNGSCYNCSLSPKPSQCICDPSCATCSQYNNPQACLSCASPLLFYQNQCLPKCPNGTTVSPSGNSCMVCNDIQMSHCYNCYSTCIQCSPFQVSASSNTCTTCSPNTRILVNGQCVCQDLEDNRQNFFECSYQSFAVLGAVLQNSTPPQLIIEFGKQFYIPVNLKANTFLKTYCPTFFQSTSLSTFGTNYQCSINGSQILVNLDSDATIFQGNLILLNPNVLSFSTSPSVMVTTFFNTMITQQVFTGTPSIVFNQPQNINSCSGFQITFVSITNSGGRGFQSINWTINQFTPQNTVQQTLLNNLLTQFSSQTQLSINIPKGVIPSNSSVVIRFSYTLLVNYVGYIDFPVNVNLQKFIDLNIQSTIVQPYTINQAGAISIVTTILLCSQNGDYSNSEPLKFSVNSAQLPSINFNNQLYQSNEYVINIAPYQVPIQQITINVSVSLVSNSQVSASGQYILNVQSSQLFVKILGGNGYFSYQSNVVITGQFIDYDLSSQSLPQGIAVVWSCTDLATSANCLDQGGNLITLSTTNSITIQKNTFKPYTVTKITATGTKPTNRQSSDSIIALFSELDLPPLGVKLTVIDPLGQTVNENEVINALLSYNSQVNPDILSFSGTIIYQEQVVGIIVFDYFQLKFQIWNYYSLFDSQVTAFQIRFNVFNPYFYMPSICILNLNINFPPSNCAFSIAMSSAVGYSLETQFILQLQNCQDQNTPISYQFFYYNSIDDYKFEIVHPQQIKRRQITDIQSQNSILTTLPSGNLILMAMAIDSKQAIFNTTLPQQVISKKYDLPTYEQIISNTILKSTNLPVNSAIFELAILCEDILLRTAQFGQDPSFYAQKFSLYQQLNSLYASVASFSTFASLADKGISSLIASGMNFSMTQISGFLQNIQTALDQYQASVNQIPLISLLKLTQRLYDSFLILDSLSNPSITPQALNLTQAIQSQFITLQNKIGDYLFTNSLPNESPILFDQTQVKIMSNQITEKYICVYFICENTQNGIDFSSSDNTQSTNIYNFKIQTQKLNVYSNNPSFQQYQQQLLSADPNIKMVQYPIITPSISDTNNKPIARFLSSDGNSKIVISSRLTSKISLQYPLASQFNKYNVSCLSQDGSNNWNNNNCQSIFDDLTKTYTCVCNSPAPTTITDDLQSVLVDNNLGEAFSLSGISNLANLKEFYAYGIFWILTTVTFGFIALYVYGQGLDNISDDQSVSSEDKEQLELFFRKDESVTSKVAPSKQDEKPKDQDLEMQNQQQDQEGGKQSSVVANVNQNDEIANLNDDDFCLDSKSIKDNMQQNRDNQENEKQAEPEKKNTMVLGQVISNVQKPDKTDSPQEQNLLTNDNLQENNEGKQLQEEEKEESKEDGEHQIHQNLKRLGSSPFTSATRPTQLSFDDLYKSRKRLLTRKQSTLRQINEEDRDNSVASIDKQIQADNQTIELKKSKTIEKFHQTLNDLPKSKILIYFHPFSSIFVLFHPQLPRNLRFLVFYVRSIHSLAISVVFNQGYNFGESIFISIISALVVLVATKILQFVYSFRSFVGLILSKIINIIIMVLYYYIILSISLGYSPNDSNNYTSNFFLFYLMDLAIISSISAVTQYLISKALLKKQKMNGFFKLVYDAIDLQYILLSLK